MPRYTANESLRIVGLAEFQRELKHVSKELGGDLRKANLAAAEVVASSARSRATSQGGVAAKSAPSVKAAAEQRRAKVAIGGAKYPFALGAEFGAKRYPQFKPWRGNQWQPDVAGVGYFLHPAIRETRDAFMDAYERAIDQLMRRAFPDAA